MSGEDLDEIVRKVRANCDVYPVKDREYIRGQIQKIERLVRLDKGCDPTDRRIVRKVSKALDMKTKIDEDDWIEYKGDKIDLQR